MKIIKLVKLKNNKYKIITDEEIIITYEDAIIENNLLFKKNIDKNMYKKIQNDTKYYDAYNKSLKYILKKVRSKKEIIEYINKYDIEEKDKNKIINKLKNNNLINDANFCRAFINDKIYLSKVGINKIKLELLQNDIPIQLIEQELKNIDENIINNRLEKMILKKIKANKKYSNNFLKQKILNDMINLGYDKFKITNIIDDNLTSEKSVLESEYDKLYNKYRTKLNGKDLISKVKTKLVLKGFNYIEIDELIQNKTED